MSKAIDAPGQAANSYLTGSVSRDLPLDSCALRICGSNIYYAHVGALCYRWVKQIAETVLPHPVLNVESG